MNETTQTLLDLPEYEQDFAEPIIDIVEKKKRKYDQDYRDGKIEYVPLANIGFKIKDFENNKNNIGIPILQEIAKRHGKSGEAWQRTAERMLGLYCRIGEIIRMSGYYKPTEHGILHKRLADKLESTP